jgi:hypothetical protein
MQKNGKLAESMAGNIIKCPEGCIHVNLAGVSLHLNEMQFLCFALMVQEASSKLMGNALNIKFDDKVR